MIRLFSSSIRRVCIATWANVEELCLVLLSGYGFGDYRYLLPHILYTNASMITLKLTWCDVAPNGLISWKSLKSLLIGYMNLSEDVIQKILVGAPILESLDLYSCWGFLSIGYWFGKFEKIGGKRLWGFNDTRR
ncbi:hypothetical protein L1049_012314 [Liquidambar formosana]|uniref:Uncharacterized protein n=1 Tax=Liquidambar formosana TaxID=63359 RepID=A0AAP0RU33_LIQFO